MKRKKSKEQSSFKGKKGKSSLKSFFISLLKVTAVLVIFGGAGFGFYYLEKYTRKVDPVEQKRAGIELCDVPEWVNETLKDKLYTAAKGDRKKLQLSDDAAQFVQRNIKSKMAWLDNVVVQTTDQVIRVKGNWRKPLAMIDTGHEKFYVDQQLVVLDYVPMPHLPIVQVTGLSHMGSIPEPGQVWRQDDLSAAIAIVARLDRMDKLVTAKKPLLFQIDSIDVSNFDGRKSNKQPHIVLRAKDSTEVIWGAQIGAWQRYLEAPDEEKLAMLYEYYKENGSLMGAAKYINLRDPRNRITQPVDKY